MYRKNIYLLLIFFVGALYLLFRIFSNNTNSLGTTEIKEKTTSPIPEIQHDATFDKLIDELNAIEIDISKFNELASESNKSRFFNSMLDFDHDTRIQMESEYLTLSENNMVSRQGKCLKLTNSNSNTLLCNTTREDTKENNNYFFAGKSSKYFIILKEEYEDSSYFLINIETLKDEGLNFTSISFSADESRALTISRDPYDSIFIYSIINFSNPSANTSTNWIQNWEIDNVYWNKSELVFSAKNTNPLTSADNTNERYGFVK